MKRNAWILGVVLSLTASACAPRAISTANPLDMQHTAEAAGLTMVAQTQEASPTATLALPTETPSLTPRPTLTPSTSPTSEVISTATASAREKCNQPLTSWQGPTAKLSIANETKPKGKIVLSLWVMTELGECGFLVDLSSGPMGQYSARAFVDGKKDFKVFGGFRITAGSWKIVVRNESIVAQGGCFPNC